MAFGSFGGRSLKVFLQGDTTDFEKALARADYKLKRFNSTAGAAAVKGVGGGGLVGMAGGRGGLAAAGAGAAALGLKSSLDAAKEAQVVLGQTQVALEDAGLSWAAYGDQVQQVSQQISRASAFDDEAVMQSFSVFVRGQKDVGKALGLSALAADVARARYMDLDAATQLVNKAAMGQTGALRRAGIQIDKNATSTQALDALQRAYGGAAERYAASAAGAQDRLRVSVENLQESMGSGALPVLTEFAGMLATSADNAGRLAETLKGVSLPGLGNAAGVSMSDVLKAAVAATPGLNVAAGSGWLASLFGGDGGKPTQSSIGDLFKATTIRDRPLPSQMAAAPKKRVEDKEPSAAAKKQQPLVPESLVGRELDARLSGSTAKLKAALASQAQFLERAIGKAKDPARRNDLKQALLGVSDEIDAIDEAAIEAANLKRDDARRAAADARARADEKRQQQQDAMRKALEASAQFADDLKQGALDLLDSRRSKIDFQRGIADAKEQMRKAKLVGDPFAIRDASRAMQDAQMDRQRWLIENAKTKPVDGRTAQFTINNLVVQANNPRELIDALAKTAKRNTVQSRGKSPSTLIH